MPSGRVANTMPTATSEGVATLPNADSRMAIAPTTMIGPSRLCGRRRQPSRPTTRYSTATAFTSRRAQSGPFPLSR